MIPELRGTLRGYTPQLGFRLHFVHAVLWLVVPLAVVALGDRRRLRTRPSLSGMVRGTVDREWAATHYPRWRSET